MSNGHFALVDVSVLVAFLWRGHVHHHVARAWFDENSGTGWASCPVTEMGCARVLSRQTVTLGRLSVARAAEALIELTAHGKHEFWPDDIPLADPRLVRSLQHIQGPRQLTDRYLLALAAAHGGSFATFDRSVGAALPPDSELFDHLEIVEP